ncbi:hypothetical protein [Acinetobacter sp. 226]|uniref:hypothetical protein n=1 Tax=Acinetobacter sp. 226 TaxID=3114699 RepID=UPI003A8B64C3
MLPHKMIDWTVLKWRAADQQKQFSPKNPAQPNAQFERTGSACILVATGTYLKEKIDAFRKAVYADSVHLHLHYRSVNLVGSGSMSMS